MPGKFPLGAQSIAVKAVGLNKTLYSKHYGKKYTFFDIASVTKAVFTTPVIIQLYQEGKISLDKTVGDYLGYLKASPLGKVKLRHLLDQTSGIVWWRPFYKKLFKLPHHERAFALKKMLLKEKLTKNPKCVYSDLNFILLGQIICEVEKLPLEKVFQKRIAKPLNLKHTFFVDLTKPRKYPRSRFAPTEKNYRGVVQGEVHDDNTASFGGISTHAGLFSTLDETSQMALELLKAYEGKSKIYKKAAFRKFARRATKRGDWALGFMIPSRPTSTGGSKISTESFGFPGFTGTSIWIDTKRRVVVTILSNRTYPTRKNEVFKETRKRLHDEIWTLIDAK